jgi:hypothetical protein
MSELIFSAMDVPREVLDLLDGVEDKVCKNMTDTEKDAYDFGVRNTLNALRALLELDDEPTVHVPGLKEVVEMDIEELEERFLNN